MKLPTLCHSILVLFLSANISFALADVNDDLENAAQKACNRIVTCTKEAMKKEGNTSKEMLAMVDQFAEATCQSYFAYKDFVDVFDIKKELIQCYTEMAEQSCENFDSGEDLPACKALEKKFENY